MSHHRYAIERHRQSQFAFYGLIALAAAVYGLIGFGIYQEWRIIGYRYDFLSFCWTFFKSHFWHLGITVLFLALLALMTWRGVMSFWCQYRDSRRLVKRVEQLAVSLPGELKVICQNYRLTGKLLLIDEVKPYAFVCGLLRPRIVISRGLVDILDRDELAAVLLHEKYHLLKFDPLKILIGRVVIHSLFFIPLAGRVFAGFNRTRELAADAMTISLQGDSLGLALALRKLLSLGFSFHQGLPVAGIMGMADLRIAQLLQEGRPVPVQIAPRRQVLLTIGAMILLLILSVSGCV